ncbi:MAG: hypothetical protein GY842_28680, partial [bacterium]|nr:hypothetical protein [bacterium]
MIRQQVAMGYVLAGMVAVCGCVVTGCDTLGGGGGITELPADVVVWGDADTENDATYASIRDANDLEDRFVLIGSEGEVQFNIGKVCEACTVEGSVILVDGEERILIRFGTGPDTEGERRPFLVSTDGFYIELVTEGEVVLFQEEDVRFEEPDDATDDLARRVGTIPNPAL